MTAATIPITTVEIAFNNNPTTALGSLTWTDVTADVVLPPDAFGQPLRWSRGRQHELSRVEAGRASFRLYNNHAKYSPWNTSSSVYGPFTDGSDTGVSGLVPMKRVRIRSTWPRTGGTTRTVWTGFVEAWTPYWPDPVNSFVDVSCVDAFKLLALRKLTSSLYRATVLADSPASYYRLGEPPSTASGYLPTFADSAGSNTLTVKGGTTPPTMGVAGALITDTDTAVTFTGSCWLEATSNWFSGTGAYTIECWGNTPTSLDTTDAAGVSWFLQQMPGPSGAGQTFEGVGLALLHAGTADDGKVEFYQNIPTGSNIAQKFSRATNDGNWHHYVVTRSSSGLVYTGFLDGVQDWTVTAGATANNGNGASSTTANGAGLALDENSAPVPAYKIANRGFSLDEVAIYTTALTSTQIASHYNVGVGGFVQQTTSARIGVILDAANWPSADRNIETGVSTVAQETESLTDTQALDACYDITETEGGIFFQQGDGKIAFFSRNHSLLNSTSTTSQVTLSETQKPWELAGSQIPMDDLDLWNEVICQRVGGVAQKSSDTASQSRYGIRTLSKTGLRHLTDATCVDEANYLLSRYATPLQRVKTVTIHPLDDPTNLFPQVLDRELLDRITAGRTQFGGGDSYSQQADIEHMESSVSADDWVTVWRLSPADSKSYWVLADSTLGQLGVTTRLYW